MIDERILIPHATSCTCSTCCDDVAAVCESFVILVIANIITFDVKVHCGLTVYYCFLFSPQAGPIRLFTPYKRRKRSKRRFKKKTKTSSGGDEVLSNGEDSDSGSGTTYVCGARFATSASRRIRKYRTNK